MGSVQLSEVLLKEAVLLDAEPYADKETMFADLAGRLEKAGIVSSAADFVKALEEREALGSTYMGQCIALPHGKSTAVRTSGVAFCRCRENFLYRSGGEAGEVRYIFMLAIAADGAADAHLRVLATLAGLLMHESFIEILEHAPSYEALVTSIKDLQDSLTD